MCPVLIWSEFRPDMNQDIMVNGQEQVPYFGTVQSILYVHKASMTVDHCTQHKQNPLIHLRYITTYKLYDIMDMNVTFWHI